MREHAMKKAFAALLLLTAGTVAEARDNRLLRCGITAARTDPGKGGPALVADIPHALTPIDLDAVLWTDVWTLRHIVLEGLFAQRTEANTIEVTARFVNCTKKPVSIQVRSNFMDKNQIPTEPASVWRTVFLSPRSTAVYQERSIGTDRVANYLIELRSNNY
jgi:hypothetical protein